MKYIIAIIQPDRLEEVIAELEEEEINLVTVSEVLGRGRQKGIAEVYRSHKEPGNLLRKVKVEIAVNDEKRGRPSTPSPAARAPATSVTARSSCSTWKSACAFARARRECRPSHSERYASIA